MRLTAHPRDDAPRLSLFEPAADADDAPYIFDGVEIVGPCSIVIMSADQYHAIPAPYRPHAIVERGGRAFIAIAPSPR